MPLEEHLEGSWGAEQAGSSCGETVLVGEVLSGKMTAACTFRDVQGSQDVSHTFRKAAGIWVLPTYILQIHLSVWSTSLCQTLSGPPETCETVAYSWWEKLPFPSYFDPWISLSVCLAGANVTTTKYFSVAWDSVPPSRACSDPDLTGWNWTTHTTSTLKCPFPDSLLLTSHWQVK